MASPGPVVTIVRHGETAWSRSGQHTGRTDIPLTAEGERQARAVAGWVGGRQFDLVLVSPRRRARRTAELAGLEPFAVDPDLVEWDYGDLEGRTSDDIRTELPDWSIWRGPWPGGETADAVGARADRLIRRLRAEPAGAQIAVVGHGHFSRVLAARWIDDQVAVGQRLGLDTATVSVLGWEHEYPVIRHWNVIPGR